LFNRSIQVDYRVTSLTETNTLPLQHTTNQ